VLLGLHVRRDNQRQSKRYVPAIGDGVRKRSALVVAVHESPAAGRPFGACTGLTNYLKQADTIDISFDVKRSLPASPSVGSIRRRCFRISVGVPYPDADVIIFSNIVISSFPRVLFIYTEFCAKRKRRLVRGAGLANNSRRNSNDGPA